jgi:hypothetical protein
MIEIILLFFLSKKNGALAQQKGKSATRWIINTIIAWIVAEVIGMMVALIFFSKDNLISIMLTAILFGVAGYHAVRSHLQKMPDKE